MMERPEDSTASTSMPSTRISQSHHEISHSASHFPQHTLTRTSSTSDPSARSSEDLQAPNAVAALASLHSPDVDMDPEPSGHRRRRSSLMNSLDTAVRSQPQRRSPLSVAPRSSIQEESRLDEAGDDDERSTSEDVELDNLSDDGLQDDEETGLTTKDKGKRKRKRRRNTLMDQRIAGDLKITADEKKEADQNVVKKSLINGLLIGLWYLFSLSISIVQPLPTPSKDRC